jgi:NhaP-type Na+/H+ or K+/H+ antiporter
MRSNGSRQVPESVIERHEIIVVAFAVVAFSIFVQGLTMPLLMRRLGVGRMDTSEQPQATRQP